MRGLDVVLLEAKPEAGARVATTGILVKEAAEEIDLPHALTRRVHGVRLHAPSLRHIDLFSAWYSPKKVRDNIYWENYRRGDHPGSVMITLCLAASYCSVSTCAGGVRPITLRICSCALSRFRICYRKLINIRHERTVQYCERRTVGRGVDRGCVVQRGLRDGFLDQELQGNRSFL
jgi:hypothetical protein